MTSRMTSFQKLAATTVIATLVLIAIGSLVRTTGSGLGCPDWPLCHGNWYPPLERTAIIEYSHRTAAAIVGLLIVAVAVVVATRHRGDRALRLLALGSLPLLAFQAWLGKVTVEHELPPSVVTLHLANALILLAILAALATYAFLGTGRTRVEARAGMANVLLACATVTYLVLISGAYVVNAGATTACPSWPGCIAARVPFLEGGFEQHVHWLHRITVLVGTGAVALAVLTVVQSPGRGDATVSEGLRVSAWLLGALYLGQILVGAANIWMQFAESVRIAHLVLGAAIWALLVVMAVVARYRTAPVASTAGRPVDASSTNGEAVRA